MRTHPPTYTVHAYIYAYMCNILSRVYDDRHFVGSDGCTYTGNQYRAAGSPKGSPFGVPHTTPKTENTMRFRMKGRAGWFSRFGMVKLGPCS